MWVIPQAVFTHIFLREGMRQLKVTQPGLDLEKAGPLRPSHHPSLPLATDCRGETLTQAPH